VQVGIITPYAQQLGELKSQFSRAMGGGFANEVEINTVDGYQGREKDIILFSCVRAGASALDIRVALGLTGDLVLHSDGP
jgi:superfamily I DNA and/or RNA helicase